MSKYALTTCLALVCWGLPSSPVWAGPGCHHNAVAVTATTQGEAGIQPVPASSRLFDAIEKVESGGNVHAVGDGGLSRGAYQIQKSYWRDACEYGGVNWSYSLVTSRSHCRQIMTWYWARYGAVTDEQRARVHNGGPRGTKMQATVKYWHKVRAELERNR